MAMIDRGRAFLQSSGEFAGWPAWDWRSYSEQSALLVRGSWYAREGRGRPSTRRRRPAIIRQQAGWVYQRGVGPRPKRSKTEARKRRGSARCRAMVQRDTDKRQRARALQMSYRMSSGRYTNGAAARAD